MLFSFKGPSNQTTHENVYLAGSLVATIDHAWPSNAVTATKYQHTDALGSPVAISDASGTIIERTNYDPYGGPIGKAVNGMGYTGHVMDGATGLTYMQQRYYDPAVGRFLSVDPVTTLENGDMRHFNRYAYAFNSPFYYSDPDGRCPVCVPLAVVGRLAVGATVAAGVEVSLQAGEQMLFEGKSWDEVEIDKSDVAVAGVVGAAFPGLGSLALRTKNAGSTISKSFQALNKLANQSRNTTARAQKVAVREAEHLGKVMSSLGDAASTAGFAATGAVLSHFGQAAANSNQKSAETKTHDKDKNSK